MDIGTAIVTATAIYLLWQAYLLGYYKRASKDTRPATTAARLDRIEKLLRETLGEL